MRIYLALGLMVALVGVAHPYVYEEPMLYSKFPADFTWGVATAAYQIEGGWDEDGKTKSIWDTFTEIPGVIDAGHNGKVACDSYHKYKEDVQLIKDMGVSSYRFSIAWTRIIPNANGEVNIAGVEYYRNLISELKVNNIEPYVTLYHWDLPQYLQDNGGWENADVADRFAEYARVCFTEFGHDVKHWITLNEPWVAAVQGHGIGDHAPGIKKLGTSVYTAGHNMIRAHAKAYRVYEAEFKAEQQGVVGITLNSDWSEPENDQVAADREAAETNQQFSLGWFAHPIYVDGDYPAVMREKIDAKSDVGNSRLPSFTQAEKDEIKGSFDFLGINHYTSKLVKPDPTPDGAPANYFTDDDTSDYQDTHWYPSAASWLRVAPFGIQKLMQWCKKEYGDVPIYITENGFSDHQGNLDDLQRIYYYKHYLSHLLKAIQTDNVNVVGYFAWSLMDNFEWARGYTEKFGLHSVDMEDSNRARTPKASAKYISNVAAYNGLYEGQETGCSSASMTAASFVSAVVAAALSLRHLF